MNRLQRIGFWSAALVAALVATTAAADLVKTSRSGICHDSSSPYYSRTKTFEPFDSLSACLGAGGRLPTSRGSSRSTPRTSDADPTPGYSRDKFGRGWDDADGDCMNTRHELLMAQSTSTVVRSSRGCSVTRGRWLDPYTGKIFFDASDVDIDHLVPLKWAWDHGASTWPASKREQFANDPVNLFAVEDRVNRQKGAKGPLEWLPPAEGFRCQYVTRFKRVVLRYGLEMRARERARFEDLWGRLCD